MSELSPQYLRNLLHTQNVPKCWHVPQPLDAGGLVGRIGLAGADVDSARDGLVDDGLLLLLQQRDQLLLSADVAPNSAVGMVEEANDGVLFGERWEKTLQTIEIVCVKTKSAFYDASGYGFDA